MPREPRDPALAAMLRATVRVGTGSGVVVRNGKAALVATAHHVVDGDGPHRIRWRDGFADATVLNSDKATDVAILAAPPQLDDVALALADAEREAEIGDDVWATGFPGGWDGAEPVLARGVVAGFGPPENWINIDGTWGNSGGPISKVTQHGGMAVGVVLGRAGESSRELAEFRAAIRQFITGLEADAELLVQHTRALFAISRDTTFDPNLVERAGRMREAAHREKGTERVLQLLDDHFRTGFLRFAAASDLRKLLA